MRKGLLPSNLRVTLMGFEDETPEQKAAREAAEKNGKGDDDDDDDDDEEGGKGKEPDNDGLKSALQKERRERKRLEKEARDLRKFKEDQEAATKSDTDKAKDDATKAESKAQKLAGKLKETAVDNAIIKLGGKLKFRDIDDALKLISRGDIEVEQDEDDPSDITVDESSVETALKALAKAKPHLIVAEGQEDKSGSKFGGGKKSQKEVDEEELKKRYPALNRSSHTS